MSVSVQQVLTDAKKLAQRLKEYESTTDTMLTKAQNLNKTVESLKEYHEEIQQLSQLSQQQQQMPRSSLIVTIQRESKQLRALEAENRELRSALEDHQYALELIMSKYRQQVNQLVKTNREQQFAIKNGPNNSDARYNNIIRAQSVKIMDMAAVMQQAAKCDEESTIADKQILAQLRAENQGLRELLKISRVNGTASLGQRSTRTIETQTEIEESNIFDVEPSDDLYNQTIINASELVNTLKKQ